MKDWIWGIGAALFPWAIAIAAGLEPERGFYLAFTLACSIMLGVMAGTFPKE